VKSRRIKAKIQAHVSGIFEFLERKDDTRSLGEVERDLIGRVFTLGRLLLAYFLARRQERSGKAVASWLRRGFRRRGKERKHLSTYFGRVTFWRTYVRKAGGKGLHPLDHVLALTADGFSLLVMSLSARLSTLVSYEQVTGLFLQFLSWSPSKTTVEKAVLGFGRYSQQWFESAPPPEDEGEVLLIHIDSKAVPTATHEELEKRRGKRRKEGRAPSPRHRGRAKRARRGPKRRKKKGDKSKNGKAATIVVMYTLERSRDNKGKEVLLGPLNKWVYASYAPKRHAFAIARREADKRGFPRGCGKTIQLVTDGDEDLERYAKDFFPEAKHTVDIMHVLEYVWEAGRFVYKEGSEELAAWVKIQESLLYKGKARRVVEYVWEIRRQARREHRKRVEQIYDYLDKRVRLMDYHRLRKKDLEVASGMVEGAVRHVIAKRFDNGSMRWIRERAEALLQLRCIEINGHWSQFVEFVAQELQQSAAVDDGAVRLLTTVPNGLPSLGVSADKNEP
jgi:hypothetical protein